MHHHDLGRNHVTIGRQLFLTCTICHNWPFLAHPHQEFHYFLLAFTYKPHHLRNFSIFSTCALFCRVYNKDHVVVAMFTTGVLQVTHHLHFHPP